jgi:uncharacterized damage-inducible protein DinB
MKKHFLKLFDYDRVANEIIVKALKDKSIATDHKAFKLMAHLLAAQQVWLTRLLGKPAQSLTLWPQETTWAELRAQLEALPQEWIAYLEEAADFEATVSYPNQSGDHTFTNSVLDGLTQVINHGTHHRAQIGQLLKAEGMEKLPPTDYIAYVRMKAGA